MEKLYLDTNCFYFFFFEDDLYHRGILKIFEKIHNKKINAITCNLTLEEFSYVTLMRLIERKFSKHPKDVLRNNPDVVKDFAPKIEDMLTTIFSFNNLEVVESATADILSIPFLMKKYSLLPRDSLHVATMERVGCKKIVSTDSDFDSVNFIQRLDPANLD